MMSVRLSIAERKKNTLRHCSMSSMMRARRDLMLPSQGGGRTAVWRLWIS